MYADYIGIEPSRVVLIPEFDHMNNLRNKRPNQPGIDDWRDIKAYRNQLRILYPNIIVDNFNFTKKNHSGNRMSAEQSYDIYKQHYPTQYDDYSMKVGFKYNTYLKWRRVFIRLFRDGITIKDVGCGNLYWFLKEDGVDVVIVNDVYYVKDSRIKYTGRLIHYAIFLDPEWDKMDDFIKYFDLNDYDLYGYRDIFLWAPTDRAIELVKLGFYIKCEGNVASLYIYDHKESKDINFSNVLCRKHISHEDFTKVKVNSFVVCNFALSNMRNRETWREVLQSWSSYGFMCTMPFKETYKVDSFKEGVYSDFTISVLDVAEYYHSYSINDFEVLVCPPIYISSQKVNYDRASYRAFKWGMLLCDKKVVYKEQTLINSPTLFIKSASELLRKTFRFNKDSLYKDRIEYLSKVENVTNLTFAIPYGYWSVSFKDSIGMQFIDVSGHSFNLLLLSMMSIIDLYGYRKMKNQSNRDIEYRDDETIFGMPLFSIPYFKSHQGNLRDELRFPLGIDLKKIMWHTPLEDFRGIDALKFVLQKYDVLYSDDFVIRFKRIWKRNIKYFKDKDSITVVHDYEKYKNELKKV